MAPKTSMTAGLKKAPAKSAVEMVSKHGKPETTYATDPFAAAMNAAVSGGSPEVRPGFKLAKAREVMPHVSLYLHPRVIAKVKEIAAVQDRKAHAVYLEALDSYLQKEHGISLASLSEG